MVAIIKFIISAALLSQASAAALRSRKTDVSVESVDAAGRHLVIGAPVLAVPRAKSKVNVKNDDLDKRAAAVANSVTQSGANGLNVVGDPVLAARPQKKVVTTTTTMSVLPKATTTSSASTSSTPLASVSAVTSSTKLIVGEPVLATRSKSSTVTKASTTLATVVKATQTAVTSH